MIVVQSQPRQIVHKTLSQKTLHKNRTGGVAQSEGSEFKPQYHYKKKRLTRKWQIAMRVRLEVSAI
jgi:hypothetical protein